MIKRSLIALAVLGGTANAQPAPPAPPAPPAGAPEPAPAPGPEPAPAPPAPAPAPEPAPAPTTTTAEVTATAAPAPEKPAEPPPQSKKLLAGKLGWLNPGLLAQAWFQNDRSYDRTRNEERTQLSQFRLRRAEISVAGEILPKKVAFKVMFDLAKVRETTKTTVAGPVDAMGNPTKVTINNPSSSISALQDFYITGLSQYADVSIGQFKIPVSWEGYNSSGKLMFPERAVVSNIYGDKRDLGVRIEKKFKKVGYSAGVFNGTTVAGGSGLNSFDTNIQKDVALRAEVYPVEGLTVAAVTYDSVGVRQRAGTKDRWEGDVRYESGPYLVQAEAIIARDVTTDQADAVPSRGMYGLFGYTITNPQLHGEMQPVVRIGAYDPDTGTDKNAQMHYDVGVNYYLQKHEMKLQLAYQRMQFEGNVKPANNDVIFAAQVMY